MIGWLCIIGAFILLMLFLDKLKIKHLVNNLKEGKAEIYFKKIEDKKIKTEKDQLKYILKKQTSNTGKGLFDTSIFSYVFLFMAILFYSKHIGEFYTALILFFTLPFINAYIMMYIETEVHKTYFYVYYLAITFFVFFAMTVKFYYPLYIFSWQIKGLMIIPLFMLLGYGYAKIKALVTK